MSDYLARAAAAGLTWADTRPLDEDDVERRIFAQIGRNEPPARVPIDRCVSKGARRVRRRAPETDRR